MCQRRSLLFLGCLLILLASSCAKLGEQPCPKPESIQVVTLPSVDSVPREWGNLISVSSVPDYPDLLQLWFQGEDGTIHMAPYNVKTSQLNPNGRLIPRK